MTAKYDRSTGQVWVNGSRIDLQDQPARALVYLIENGARVVTRDELIAHIWNDGRHVQFDQGLNYCIREIRAALGDAAASPKYVATIGRRGYRWIGPRLDDRQTIASVAHRPVPAWLAAAASMACIVGTMWLAAPPPGGTSVANRGDVLAAVHTLHAWSHQVFDPVTPSVVRFLYSD